MSGWRTIAVVLGRIVAGLALAALLLAWAACGQPSRARIAPTPTPPTAAPTLKATETPFPTQAPRYVWIPLASHSDAAILAAVRQSKIVQLVSTAPAGTDGSWDVSRLGAPVYIAAYRAHATQPTYDYYIVPGYDSAGQITDLISAMLNQTHTAIFVPGISGYDSAWFPSTLVSASQAESIVERQQHTALRAGAQPALVYLAGYNTGGVEAGQVKWNAGGGGPQNPIWLIPGADEQDHFVGTDGNAYILAQLPLL